MTWRESNICRALPSVALTAAPEKLTATLAPEAVPWTNTLIAVAADGSAAVSTHGSTTPGNQGLTLVHFSAQLERFVWDGGCA
jgi:hypothetical protein